METTVATIPVWKFCCKRIGKKIFGAFAAFVSLAAMFAFPASAQESNKAQVNVAEVCEDVCFDRGDNGLFSCQRKCDDTDPIPRLPVGLYFVSSSIQRELKPPVVVDAELSPNPPRAGEVLKVNIKLEKSEAPENMPIINVFYSYTGPKEWKASPAEFNIDEKVFTAFIPVPSDAVKLNWFVRAVTPYENSYIEIPCQVKNFPFKPDECLVPLVDDASYADYEGFNIDPSRDILKSRVGMDDKYLYFVMQAAGKIKEGETIPTEINVYYVGITDPAAYSRKFPMSNMLFAIYSPIMYSPNSCVLLKRRASEWVSDPTAIKCIVENDLITFRIPRKQLFPFSKGYMNVFLGINSVLHLKSTLNMGTNYEFNKPFSDDQIAMDDMGVIADYTGATIVRQIVRETAVTPEE